MCQIGYYSRVNFWTYVPWLPKKWYKRVLTVLLSQHYWVSWTSFWTTRLWHQRRFAIRSDWCFLILAKFPHDLLKCTRKKSRKLSALKKTKSTDSNQFVYKTAVRGGNAEQDLYRNPGEIGDEKYTQFWHALSIQQSMDRVTRHSWWTVWSDIHDV